MHKRAITYTDFEGEEHTEDFYFNLTKTECVELDLGASKRGLAAAIQLIFATQDREALFQLFKRVILSSYGERHANGVSFVKSDEVREAFEYHPAFDELIMELGQDQDKMAEFFIAIMPKEVRESADMQQAFTDAKATATPEPMGTTMPPPPPVS